MKVKLVWYAAIVLLAAVAVGCETERPPETGIASPTPIYSPSPTISPSPGETPMPGAALKVADVTGNVDNYVGKTVTVSSEIDQVYGPRAFKLDDDSPLAGGIDNDLLVLVPKNVNIGNIDDQWKNNKVRASGVVRKMVVRDIEREIGWDLDTRIESEFKENRAVLIANSVERVQQ